MTREDIRKQNWRFQDEFDIWYSFNDGYHRFVCVMNDNSVHIFIGNVDSDINGELIKYVYCSDDTDRYDIDDIIAWTEIPMDIYYSKEKIKNILKKRFLS